MASGVRRWCSYAAGQAVGCTPREKFSALSVFRPAHANRRRISTCEGATHVKARLCPRASPRAARACRPNRAQIVSILPVATTGPVGSGPGAPPSGSMLIASV